MLPAKESLTVEFKSEQKRPQSHDEIGGFCCFRGLGSWLW